MATGKSYNSIDSKEQLILVQTGKGKFGGYKQELLVNSLHEVEIEFYVCTQCKGVMRNACQLGEEQIPVCEICVGKKVSILPMMKARKKIPELKANCPIATRGCKWNATLSEVSQHLDVCQEFITECKYDCGVIIKRCELNNHCDNECVYREVSCEHCRSMIVYKAEHDSVAQPTLQRVSGIPTFVSEQLRYEFETQTNRLTHRDRLS